MDDNIIDVFSDINNYELLKTKLIVAKDSLDVILKLLEEKMDLSEVPRAIYDVARSWQTKFDELRTIELEKEPTYENQILDVKTYQKLFCLNVQDGKEYK